MPPRRPPSLATPATPASVVVAAAEALSDPTAAPPGRSSAAYAPAVKAGFKATATQVQHMHQAISAKTFDTLQQVPGLALPAGLVRSVHDAVTQGVYAAVRQGGAAALTLAGLAERLGTDPSKPIARGELSLRSALNAAFGDTLARGGSALSVGMGFHADGQPLPLTPEALAGLKPRVAVFIHGLACDEHSWLHHPQAWAGSAWASALPEGTDIGYGTLLAHELDMSAIYLRYNTGLAVDDNARTLAAQLQQLVQRAPARLHELVLIGHSMGGLVARAACDEAQQQGLSWRQRTGMLICLGTPHQGARLEQLGRLTSAALSVSDVTQPLSRLANARSQGVKDLRHGPRGKKAGIAASAEIPLRLVVGGLADESSGVVGKMVGKLLGDGLVVQHSAADAGLVGDVLRVELPGLGHMALLSHPRVYAALRSWLTPTTGV